MTWRIVTPYFLVSKRMLPYFNNMQIIKSRNRSNIYCFQPISEHTSEIVLALKKHSAVYLISPGATASNWSSISRNEAVPMISPSAQTTKLRRNKFWISMKCMHWLWLWTTRRLWLWRHTTFTNDIHMPNIKPNMIQR